MKNTRHKNSLVKEKKVITNRSGKIPYGRDAVKKAILNAAEKLLSKKGPSEITVREIAKVANVKHPLIYRHFGTKNNVIMAVHLRGIGKIQTVVAKVASIEGNAATFFDAAKKNKLPQIILARAMMDGVDPHLLQDQFPAMQHLLALLKNRKIENNPTIEFDSQVLTAFLGATVLGWMLYEPFLLASTGLEGKNNDEIHKGVVEILDQVITKIG